MLVRQAFRAQLRRCGAVPFGSYQRTIRGTLEAICEVLDEEAESYPQLEDITPLDGVLEIDVADVGTYVLNKQDPRQELWLSSPISGPSQFALSRDAEGNAQWQDPTNGRELYSLLRSEFKTILEKELVFPPVSLASA